MVLKRHILAAWGGGILLFTIALVAGGLSGTMNVLYGSKTSIGVAIAYGLSDAGKIVIPVIASMIGWRFRLYLAAVLTTIVSVWCAANYLADTHGQAFLEMSHKSHIVKNQQDKIKLLTQEVRVANNLIEDERKNGGCGPKCKEHIADRDAAKKELQAARQSIQNAEPVEVSGLAMLSSTIAGFDKDYTARVFLGLKVLAALIVVEILAQMMGEATKMIGTALDKQKRAKGAAQKRRKKPGPKPGSKRKPRQNVLPLREVK
jgi:hypothetical protein